MYNPAESEKYFTFSKEVYWPHFVSMLKNVLWQNIATLYSFKSAFAQLCKKLDVIVLHQAPITHFSIRMKTVLVYTLPLLQQHTRCNHRHVITHGCLVTAYLLPRATSAWAIRGTCLSQLVHFYVWINCFFSLSYYLTLNSLSPLWRVNIINYKPVAKTHRKQFCCVKHGKTC